ncbi:hypothetical protein [Streptomyces sp. LN704]
MTTDRCGLFRPSHGLRVDFEDLARAAFSSVENLETLRRRSPRAARI